MYTFKEFYISDSMMDGIERYLNNGIPPGDFLTAIICNDLSSAVVRADDTNLRNIPAFVAYFYNEAPIDSWGSAKQMMKWMVSKREKS
jgi:hypothetical protein